MAISGGDLTLVDLTTGVLLSPDTTVIVPEVLGGLGYDILEDSDSAIEYGLSQGLPLEDPDADGLPVTELEFQPRGYLAIDTDTGYVAEAFDVVLIELPGDDEDDLDTVSAREKGRAAGQVPVAPKEVLDLEGLPFESVIE